MPKPSPVPAATLFAAIAKELDCSRAQAKRLSDGVQSAVQNLLADGHPVRLPGLATFSVVDVPERQVRNPATGEMQTAAPTRQVRVSATGPLKAAVKGNA